MASLDAWISQYAVKSASEFIEKLRGDGQPKFTEAEAMGIYRIIQRGGNVSDQGASNMVSLMNVNGRKIAVRIAIDSEFTKPWYYFGGTRFTSRGGQYDLVQQRTIPMTPNKREQLYEKNREIWVKTSGVIAPELFFYGYRLH